MRIIQALAFQKLGDLGQAKNVLNRALTYGEQGGFVWMFVREGEPMENLLRLVIDQRTLIPYLELLLNAFNTRQNDEENGIYLNNLPEPLTDRELEVLQILDSDLTIPEIADTLLISVGTVRTHIKRIYRKLDVHSRFEAVMIKNGEKVDLKHPTA
jgi:LuxR family maltose regulon positive regulatory protein